MTRARRSGMEKVTPRMPPKAQIRKDSQKGKPVHQPTMTRAGRTKMIEEMAPPTEATVWTVMFSQMVEVLEGAQHGHRDDGRGDGRGEGEADLEAEIDVGGGEDDGEQAAQDEGADGEFDASGRRGGDVVCSDVGHWSSPVGCSGGKPTAGPGAMTGWTSASSGRGARRRRARRRPGGRAARAGR